MRRQSFRFIWNRFRFAGPLGSGIATQIPRIKRCPLYRHIHLMNSLSKYLSIRTIYIFASVKMIFWAIGIILFKTASVNTAIVPIIESSFWAQIVLLATGIAGLTNFFLKKRTLYILTAIEMSLFWTYALFLFGVSNTSFFRTIPETVLIYLMTAYLIFKKGKIAS